MTGERCLSIDTADITCVGGKLAIVNRLYLTHVISAVSILKYLNTCECTCVYIYLHCTNRPYVHTAIGKAKTCQVIYM